MDGQVLLRHDEDDVIEGSLGGPYMVEKIVGIFMGKNHKKYYQVQWIDSWEPEENLSEACQSLIDEFWAGKTFDSQGKEVKKSDLKTGQKVIKKEDPPQLNPNEERSPTKNPQAPQHFLNRNTGPILPTLKTDNSSDTRTSSDRILKPSQLKKELLTNNGSSSKATSSTEPSITDQHPVSPKNKDDHSSTNENEDPKSSLDHVNNPPSSPIDSSTNLKTKQTQSESTQVQIEVPLTSKKMNTTQKTTKTSRRSVDGSTQTDFSDGKVAVQKGNKKSSVQSKSSRNFSSQTSEDGENGSSPVAPMKKRNSIIVTDIPQNSTTPREFSSEELTEVDSMDDCTEVLDLEGDTEDDELEITVYIESPSSNFHDPKNKRSNSQNLNKGSPNKRPYIQQESPLSRSGGGQRSRSRVKTTNKRRKERTNTSTFQSNSVKSTPMHPRNLLPSYPSPSNVNEQSTLNSSQSPIRNNNIRNSPARNRVIQNVNRPSDSFLLNNRQHSQPENSPTRTKQLQNKTNNLFNQNSPSSRTADRTCNICKQTFPNLTHARQHMRQIHNDQCSPSSSKIDLSVSYSSSPSSSSGDTSNVTCNICFGIFRNNRDLKSHMLLHTDHENLHQCQVCLRAFRSKATLQQHSLIHTEELPYECQTCGKCFRQQGHLITHMGKHSQNNEGSFHCPYCSCEFANSYEFRNHIHTHEQELPFNCNQCQERFQSKSDLMTHLDAHNEGRPFTCHICKKSFKTKTYLYGHMQMHKSGITDNSTTVISNKNAIPQSSKTTIIKTQDNE